MKKQRTFLEEDEHRLMMEHRFKGNGSIQGQLRELIVKHCAKLRKKYPHVAVDAPANDDKAA